MARKRLEIGIAVRGYVRAPSGEVLLLRRDRRSRHFAGQWELPGGKLDPGETVEQALLREVREETGLSIALGPLVAVEQSMLPGWHVVLLVLEARTRSKRVTISDEHEDAKWTTLEEALELDLSPQVRPFLERVHADFARASAKRALNRSRPSRR